MVFSSHIFLFYFLPLFLLVYFMLPFTWRGFYVKNAFITIMSYVFYGWLVPWFVILMFITTLKDYWCGLIISRPGQLQWKRKAALIFAVAADLGLLAYFKYYMFFMAQVVNPAAGLLGLGPHAFTIATVLLPSGISFYTFVALSYTIDVYRG
ncbi:MAG: membrane-bound O-acyltransferase family protein, partial [Chitinispirillaceae bacterium]|nr:membrane-bound O-acyltransferase family protein [Chitinispirillaceae bacterium]